MDIDSNGEMFNRKELKHWDGWDEKVQGYYYRYRSNCVKWYPDYLPEIRDVNIGRLIRLSKLILPKTNLFAKKKRRRNEFEPDTLVPITKQEMQKCLNLRSYEAFCDMWKEFEEFNIVKRVVIDGKKFWCVNPAYCNTCKHIPLWLYKEFYRDLDKNMTQNCINRYTKAVLEQGGFKDNSEYWK